MTFVKKMFNIVKHLFKKEKRCYDLNRKERRVDIMAKYDSRLEHFAKEILVKNDMLKLPVNLIEIANNNDIEVYYVHLSEGVSGAIRYNKDIKKFQILIEKNEPEYRKRFTLAHELAHFFLERNTLLETEKIHYDVLYRSNIGEKERDVDYLAGALLMNADILKKLYRINPSIRELAKTFNVSDSALTVRLMTIGVL